MLTSRRPSSSTFINRLVQQVQHVLPEGRPLPPAVWRVRHLTILGILWLHVIGIAVFGLLAGLSIVHSLLDAAPLAIAAVLATTNHLPRRVRAMFASFGLILASAILVHISGGYIEFHFHFFVMIVVIAFYQDWAPFLIASGFVLVEHGVLGVLMPQAVYNHPDAWAHPWKWAAIHALFLSGSSIASLISWRLSEAARTQTDLIVNSVGEGICGVDLGGIVAFVNPAAATMLGWQQRDMIGMSVHTLLCPSHAPRPTGTPATWPSEARIELSGMKREANTAFWRTDGTTFPVEYTCTPTYERGSHSGTVITFTDITERKLTEEVLRESEERFRGAFDFAATGMALVALDGRLLRTNRSLCMMLGYSEAELLATTFRALTYPDDLALDLAAFQRLLEGSADSYQLEKRYLHKNGHTVWGLLTGSLIRDSEGQPLYALGQIQDIGGRKAAESALRQANDELERRVEERTAELATVNLQLQVEAHDREQATLIAHEARQEAEAANRAKSEFLSRMSHELRTPLNAILGFAQILEMGALTPRQQESVGFILKGGRHLLAMINEVLDISRIEAGHLDLSFEPVAVNDILHETLDLVRPLAARQQVTLHVPAMPCAAYVWADRQRMVQVLLNLLSNAVKYNREAGTVTLTCAPAPDERLRILVSDTGPGLAPAQLTRLFTPFERLGAERIGIEGTGLGLSLARRLVEAMGGELGVASTPGQGSTFWVDLRRAETPLLPLAPEIAAARELEADDPPRTVLYIEDNLSNLRLIEHLLLDRPATRLLAAMQGQLGLELAREHHPDLILLDLHLPDVQGETVLQQLQADPGTRAIPVVMLSADATPHQVERLLALGACAYLTKPLDIPTFLQVLHDVLHEEL